MASLPDSVYDGVSLGGHVLRIPYWSVHWVGGRLGMDWQRIVAFLLVALAALFLVRTIWNMVQAFWKEGSVCKVCNGCALSTLKRAADKKKRQAQNAPLASSQTIPLASIQPRHREGKGG